MDRDEILRQGKDIAGKLRDEASEQAAQHEQQIKDVLGKVVGFVNEKTGGKYAEQVGKAAGFVELGVDKLVEGSRGGSGPTSPGSGPTSPGSEPEGPGSGPASPPPSP